MAGNHHCQGQGGLPSGPSCTLGVPGVGLRRCSRHSLLVCTRALAQRGSKQARGCPRCQQGHLTQGAVSCSACEHVGYTTPGRGSVGVALCDSLAYSDALLGPLEHCFQPLKDPRRQVDHTLAYGQHGHQWQAATLSWQPCLAQIEGLRDGGFGVFRAIVQLDKHTSRLDAQQRESTRSSTRLKFGLLRQLLKQSQTAASHAWAALAAWPCKPARFYRSSCPHSAQPFAWQLALEVETPFPHSSNRP